MACLLKILNCSPCRAHKLRKIKGSSKWFKKLLSWKTDKTNAQEKKKAVAENLCSKFREKCLYKLENEPRYLHWAAIFPFPILRSFLTTKICKNWQTIFYKKKKKQPVKQIFWKFTLPFWNRREYQQASQFQGVLWTYFSCYHYQRECHL